MEVPQVYFDNQAKLLTVPDYQHHRTISQPRHGEARSWTTSSATSPRR
jgi:hypothetical protein